MLTIEVGRPYSKKGWTGEIGEAAERVGAPGKLHASAYFRLAPAK